jgi:hypothetical protein
MGEYLTYVGSSSFEYSGSFPDENYAREIMQLFTVGLWKLNDDGTQVLDANNEPVHTYSTKHIVTLARAWTGFDEAPKRENVEKSKSYDPMVIKTEWRDRFPKTNLEDGYYGDGYPVCTDLPERHFLTKGANFEFLGAQSFESNMLDDCENFSWASDLDCSSIALRGRFAPPPTSALYSTLCAPDAGACTFPASVTLSENLYCEGIECDVAEVRVVQIVEGDSVQYFRYNRVPCVRLTLFEGGKVTEGRYGGQCTNPLSRTATTACCDVDDRVVSNFGPEALFANERMDLATARARCDAQLAYYVCQTHDISGAKSWAQQGARDSLSWTETDCEVTIQVHPNGFISLVDSRSTEPTLGLYSAVSFDVQWDEREWPTVAAGCPAPGCTALPDKSCHCEVHVATSKIFEDPNNVPSVATVRAALAMGAPHPETFPTGVYAQCLTASCTAGGMTVWTKGGVALNEDTIFILPSFRAGGKDVPLFNRRSTVRAGAADGPSFRNPPHFNRLLGEVTSFLNPTAAHDKDPIHETEAVMRP